MYVRLTPPLWSVWVPFCSVRVLPHPALGLVLPLVGVGVLVGTPTVGVRGGGLVGPPGVGVRGGVLVGPPTVGVRVGVLVGPVVAVGPPVPAASKWLQAKL